MAIEAAQFGGDVFDFEMPGECPEPVGSALAELRTDGELDGLRLGEFRVARHERVHDVVVEVERGSYLADSMPDTGLRVSATADGSVRGSRRSGGLGPGESTHAAKGSCGALRACSGLRPDLDAS